MVNSYPITSLAPHDICNIRHCHGANFYIENNNLKKYGFPPLLIVIDMYKHVQDDHDHFQWWPWPFSLMTMAIFNDDHDHFHWWPWPFSMMTITIFNDDHDHFQWWPWPFSMMTMAIFNNDHDHFQWWPWPFSLMTMNKLCFPSHWSIKGGGCKYTLLHTHSAHLCANPEKIILLF